MKRASMGLSRRAFTRIGTLALGGSVLPLLPFGLACSKRDAETSSAGPEAPPAPASSEAHAAAPGALRAPGSRLSFVLPDGMRRVARAEWYGREAPHVLIEVREGTSNGTSGVETAQLMNTLYGMTRDFHIQGGIEELKQPRGFFMSKGRLDRHLDREENEPVAARLLVGVVGGAMTTLVATFDDGGEAYVEEFVRSVVVHEAPLDPLLAHGVSLHVAPGYEVRREMLDPMVIAPLGSRWPIPPHGPSVEISFSKPPGDADAALKAALSEQAVFLKAEAPSLALSMSEHYGSPAMEAELPSTLNGVRIVGLLLGIHDAWGVMTCMTRVPETEAAARLPQIKAMLATLQRSAPPLTS